LKSKIKQVEKESTDIRDYQRITNLRRIISLKLP